MTSLPEYPLPLYILLCYYFHCDLISFIFINLFSFCNPWLDKRINGQSFLWRFGFKGISGEGVTFHRFNHLNIEAVLWMHKLSFENLKLIKVAKQKKNSMVTGNVKDIFLHEFWASWLTWVSGKYFKTILYSFAAKTCPCGVNLIQNHLCDHLLFSPIWVGPHEKPFKCSIPMCGWQNTQSARITKPLSWVPCVRKG